MTKPIEHINNHVEQALGLLVEQFRECDSITGLVRALVNQVQEVEDMFFSLIDGRLLASSTGVQLDKYGAIVGEKRNGRSDAAYRVAIAAQLVQNLAQGEPERVIGLVQTLTGASYVQLTEDNPGVVNISFDGFIATTVAEFVEIIESVLAAGVRFEGQQLPTSPAVIVTVPNPPSQSTTYTVSILNTVTDVTEEFVCVTDTTPTAQELLDCFILDINTNGTFSFATDNADGETFTLVSSVEVVVTVTGVGMGVEENQLNWFAFEGNTATNVAGYSSLANPTVGGVLSRLIA
jgi:hypothetical protein